MVDIVTTEITLKEQLRFCGPRVTETILKIFYSSDIQFVKNMKINNKKKNWTFRTAVYILR